MLDPNSFTDPSSTTHHVVLCAAHNARTSHHASSIDDSQSPKTNPPPNSPAPPSLHSNPIPLDRDSRRRNKHYALFKSAPTPNHWLLPHWRKNFNFFQLQAVAWTSVLTAVLDLAAVLLVIDVTLVCNTATFLVFFLAQMCR